MGEQGKLYDLPIIRLKDGDSEVDITVFGKYEREAREVFDSVCDGFELIAKTYPDYVRYRRVFY